MGKKLSRSNMFQPTIEMGTPELRAHHKIEIHPLDYRGLVSRARVVDQHEIDRMLHCELISCAQHAGAEGLLESFALASFPRSAELEPGIRVRQRDGDSAVGRWLAISAPLNALRRRAPESIRVVCALVASNVRVKRSDLGLCRQGLDALAKHFGTVGMRDPRAGLKLAL